MGRLIPDSRLFADAITVSDDGERIALKAEPLSDRPGFEGYLVPFYVLTDRGTAFLPGSFKKTAREQKALAPHLFQHDTFEPIGKHVAALEDDKGFRIAVELNEGIQRGAEVLSNLRFGTPLAMSVGYDPIQDRSGTEADDKKLDRRSAPGWIQEMPINEVRFVKEARWWESSTVTFPGLGTARPDIIHGTTEEAIMTVETHLQRVLAAVDAGDISPDDVALIEQLVAAIQPAAPPPLASTDELAARRRIKEMEARLTLARASLLEN